MSLTCVRLKFGNPIESVVTKLSTKFSRATKRFTSLASATAIALVGLVATSAAPAQAGPVTKPTYLTISRTTNSQTGSVVIHNGESLSVTIMIYSASFVSDGTKTAVSTAALDEGIVGLTYGSKGYDWNVIGCTGVPAMTATVTPCAQATELRGYVRQTITNNSGSDKTITSNMASAVINYGGTALGVQERMSYANRNPSSSELSSGFIYTSDDVNLNGGLTLCLTEGAVSSGDVLTWEVTTLNGTTPVSNVTSFTDPSIELTYFADNSSNNVVTGNTLTVASPVPSQFNLYVNGFNLTSGTYHFSVDLKKNGNSVLTACSTGPGPGGPIALLTGVLGSVAGAANATVSEKALGANVVTSASGAFGPDGQGGLLVLSPSVTPGTYLLANVTPAGAKANFGGSGKISIAPTDPQAMTGSVGWFGSAQSGWALDFYSMDGGNEVVWGAKANAVIKRKVFTTQTLNSFCSTNASAGFTMGHFGAIMSPQEFLNAPTADPMMFFACSNEQTMDEEGFIVKVTTAGITKVVSTKSATVTQAKPCSGVDSFVNPAATGTGVAALLVVRNYAKTAMGNGPASCYGYGGASGNRRLTTITSAGVAKVYTANISTGVIPEASSGVSFGPGSVAGTWVGVVHGGTPAKATRTVKVSATGVVTLLKTMTLDAASVFSQTGSFIPVKQLPNGSILALRRSYVPGMAPSYKWALAKIDATGKVTTGKVLTITAAGMMDSWSPKNLSSYSVSQAGVVNYYFVSKYTETPSGNKIKVVTWVNPAK